MYVDAGFVYYGTSSGVVTRVPIDGSTGPTTITFGDVAARGRRRRTNVYVASIIGRRRHGARVHGANVIATTFVTGVVERRSPRDRRDERLLARLERRRGLAREGELDEDDARDEARPSRRTSPRTAPRSIWGPTDGSIRELSDHRRQPPRHRDQRSGQVVSVAVDATRVYWTTPAHVRSTSK